MYSRKTSKCVGNTDEPGGRVPREAGACAVADHCGIDTLLDQATGEIKTLGDKPGSRQSTADSRSQIHSIAQIRSSSTLRGRPRRTSRLDR